MKTCTQCKMEKPLRFFYRDKRGRSGFAPACKVCQEEARRKNRARHYAKNKVAIRARTDLWRKNNPEKWLTSCRERSRKSKGMPSPLRAVPEFCECCRSPPGTVAMNLDHCHATGKFRGWLCRTCNLGIGQLNDNIEGLIRALAYLQKNGAHVEVPAIDELGNPMFLRLPA